MESYEQQFLFNILTWWIQHRHVKAKEVDHGKDGRRDHIVAARHCAVQDVPITPTVLYALQNQQQPIHTHYYLLYWTVQPRPSSNRHHRQ